MNARRLRVLIVFGRAPVHGRVKSRLAAAHGRRGSLVVYKRLLADTLVRVVNADIDRLILSVAPGPGHPFIRRLGRRFQARLRAQPAGDLGQRMLRSMRRELPESGSVVLIGSDCAIMDQQRIGQAFDRLEQGADWVFAPAEDGGYALVGSRRPDSRLFTAMSWGGSGLMVKTRARLRRTGRPAAFMPTVWDLDRPADLKRARRAGLL